MMPILIRFYLKLCNRYKEEIWSTFFSLKKKKSLKYIFYGEGAVILTHEIFDYYVHQRVKEHCHIV